MVGHLLLETPHGRKLGRCLHNFDVGFSVNNLAVQKYEKKLLVSDKKMQKCQFFRFDKLWMWVEASLWFLFLLQKSPLKGGTYYACVSELVESFVSQKSRKTRN